MGIDGLLKLLKPITEKEHLSSFKNQTLGVDIMPWIYKGCYSCNFQLSQNIQSVKFLYYLLEMIEMLSYYNIKPIFVFDGKNIQMKAETQERRKKQKQENKAKGLKFLNDGNIEQARKYLSRCIFLDERIISKTIDVLFSKNLQFIVAPYEADCQLAKLKNLGIIDAAISQDSDLLAYGVNTILKLTHNGDCDYIDVQKWRPRDVDSQFLKEYLAMDRINKMQVCILAGCDYSCSIKGIGIMRAVRNLYKQATIKNLINKLQQQQVYSDRIPEDYYQKIVKVKMVFLFGTVYNPTQKKLQYLNPELLDLYKPQDISLQQLDKIVGQKYPQYIEQQVYCGKYDPKEMKVREINTVNIRELFSVNKEKLLVQEAMNRRRKQQVQILMKQRKQQIESGVVADDTKMMQNTTNTSPTSNKKKKVQLTEEEKEKRKQQRKNRIVKLQDMMNSVVEMYDQESKQIKNQQKQQHIVSNNKLSMWNKKIDHQQQQNISQKSLYLGEDQEESSSNQMQQSQSMQFDLAHLNPFAKKQLQTTATKVQKVNKSARKN